MFSCQNLPHDAYKLLAVPSPIGGVLVIAANTIHYHSEVDLFHCIGTLTAATSFDCLSIQFLASFFHLYA